MHVQKDRKNKEANDEPGSKFPQKSFHGSSFVFSPICIGRTGKRAESFRFSFLHQDDSGHDDADDDHDDGECDP